MIEEFLRHLADGRQLSAHTVAAYRRDLADLTEFLDHYYGGNGWSWSGVDRLALRSFMGHLARRGLSRRSIGRKRSEEHTSELQSRENLVCRLLLEKKKKNKKTK